MNDLSSVSIYHIYIIKKISTGTRKGYAFKTAINPSHINCYGKSNAYVTVTYAT